jgi:Undecaprenyl-phosphate galactose phosphotransferase WbaP
MDERVERLQWAEVDSSTASPVQSEMDIETARVSRLSALNVEFRPSFVMAKRILDIAGALALATVFSPLLLIVTLLQYGDGESILFRQIRVGKNGRAFMVYKFRTMVPNANQVLRELLAQNPELRAEWLRDHKLKDDPRVTMIGKLLRKTSLDELPQLWNVIRGDMSLVGPRPIVRAELPKYGRTSRYYLALKPGLTGIWQISGRNDTDYRRRVAMDRHYARTASLRLDLVVLAKTVDVVLRRRGAY